MCFKKLVWLVLKCASAPASSQWEWPGTRQAAAPLTGLDYCPSHRSGFEALYWKHTKSSQDFQDNAVCAHLCPQVVNSSRAEEMACYNTSLSSSWITSKKALWSPPPQLPCWKWNHAPCGHAVDDSCPFDLRSYLFHTTKRKRYFDHILTTPFIILIADIFLF